ncbi:hypothetical protein, partial [Phenylobacterium aquaticum]
MAHSDRRRIMTVVAASAAFHLGLLGLLALQRPNLRERALAPALLDVTLAPFYLIEPEAKGRRTRAPLKTHGSRPLEAALPVAPIYAAPADTRPNQAVAPGPVAPASLTPGAQTPLGLVLRRGGVGCETPNLPGMTQADRDRCLERLGAGARLAAFKGLGLAKDKQAWLDGQAAAKDRYIKYRNGPLPPGLSTSDAAGG